jgi:hypothetical protein
MGTECLATHAGAGRRRVCGGTKDAVPIGWRWETDGKAGNTVTRLSEADHSYTGESL